MNFTVYRSSAGSGKTYTLVKEFLKLSLATDQLDAYKHVLAITFTNKAANEMKQRIIDSLKAFASSDTPTGTSRFLLKDLCSELNLSEHEIQLRSSRVLSHMLHNYADLSVQTIDKFVHRVIRTFAFDLDIPMNFEVELEADALLKNAIDLLVADIGSDENLTQALVDFTESKADSEKSWHIENDLLKFSNQLIQENGQLQLEKIRYIDLNTFFEIRDKIQIRLQDFEKDIRKIGEEAQEIIYSSYVDESSFAGGRNGLPKFFSYLASFQSDKLYPTATITKYIEQDQWYSSKASASDKDGIDRIKNELKEKYQQAIEYLEQNGSNFHLYNLINKNIYALAVLTELEKIIARFKDDNNVLHISEFNKRISNIIANEPAPFIYERLGERYRHFLIDEFQDTSVMQWKNLLPLVQNSLASGYFNMIVGDGKQSIYRWRGGEVEQFSKLPEPYETGEQQNQDPDIEIIKRSFEEKKLRQNYRSKAELVEFNNSFFREISTYLDENLSTIYLDTEQEFNPENTGGYISVEALSQENGVGYKETTLSRIKNIIEELQEDGYEAQDITILCRYNREAAEVAAYLISNSIEVVSSESLILSSSDKVRFIIAFLKYLSDTTNKIYISELLMLSDRLGFIDDELNKHLSLVHAKDTKFSIDKMFYAKGYHYWAETLIQLPVYETVEESVRIFGLNNEVDPYITFLLEFAYTHSSRQNNNLAAFVELWTERMDKLSIVVPENTQAVRIMTIHKSKGLEFPVVIYPFLGWSSKAGNENLWIDINDNQLNLHSALIPTNKSLVNTEFSDDYEEEQNKTLLDNINLTYVAFTRPVEQLYVLTEASKKKKEFRQHEFNFLTQKPEWNSETMKYQIGVRQKKQKPSQQDNTVSKLLPQLISVDWRNKVAISKGSKEFWDSDEERVTIGKTVLMRTALSEIQQVSDTKGITEKMVATGLLNLEGAAKLKTELDTLLKQPEIARFFQPEMKAENKKTILTPSGETLQPDRVVFEKDNIALLNYSTGKGSKKEKEKVMACSKAVAAIGNSKVEAYLLSLETGLLEPIQD